MRAQPEGQIKHRLVLISLIVIMGAMLIYQQIEIATLRKETREALESSESAIVKANHAISSVDKVRETAEEAKSVAEEAKSTADDALYGY